jgi:hypothetical protein
MRKKIGLFALSLFAFSLFHTVYADCLVTVIDQHAIAVGESSQRFATEAEAEAAVRATNLPPSDFSINCTNNSSSTTSMPTGTDSASQLGGQIGAMLGNAIVDMFKEDELAAERARALQIQRQQEEAERQRQEAIRRRQKYEADKTEVLNNLRDSAPDAGGGLRDIDTSSSANQGMRDVHTDTDSAPPVQAQASQSNQQVPVDNSLQMSNYFFELQTRQLGLNGAALANQKPAGLPIDTTNMVTASSTDLDAAAKDGVPGADTSSEMLKAGVGEAVNQGYDLAAPAVAESVLSKSFDETPGVDNAYSAGQIMLQIKEGDLTGAGSSTIKFAVGKIPLEGYGIASAQMGGAIYSKTVRADVIGFFQKANGAVGDDASWDHAEHQYNDIFSGLTTAQKTAAADMGE